MTFVEAAAEVLRLLGKPLHYKDITAFAIEKNLLSHVGKNPEVTMGTRLTASFRKPEEDNPLVRVRPGVFALKEWEATGQLKLMLSKAKAADKAAAAHLAAEDAAPDSTESPDVLEAPEPAAPEAAQPADEPVAPVPVVEEPVAPAPVAEATPQPDPSLPVEAAPPAELVPLAEPVAVELVAVEPVAVEPVAVEPVAVEPAPAAALAPESVRPPQNDDDDQAPSPPEDREEAARAELAAGAEGVFEEEDDDDRPILGGDGTQGDATRRRRRRRRRGGKGPEDNGITYTATPMPPEVEPRAEPRAEVRIEPRELRGVGRNEPRSLPPVAPPQHQVVHDISANGLDGVAFDDFGGKDLADAIALLLQSFDRSAGPVSLRQIAESAQKRGRLAGDVQQLQSQVAASVRADNLRRTASGLRPRFRFVAGRISLTDWLLSADLTRFEQEAIAAVERYRDAARKAFARKLQELPGHAFVELSLLLLEKMGLRHMRAVRRAGVPGFEAHFTAIHETGAAEIATAIVMRRDGREIGRERVTELRGSLHHYGPAAVGWILTAGPMLSGARDEAAATNTGTIVLLDGLNIARLCEQNDVAVVRTTLPIAIPDLDVLEALRSS